MLLVLAALCLSVTFAAADDTDGEGAGFFHYLPAPDIKLPKFDIIPFWTDDLKKARKAYNKGDYGRAMRLFRKQSDDGSAVADWYLGHMYRLGRGVSPDPAVAYSYYQRVSENYDPDEQDELRLKIMVDSQLHLADYTRTGIPTAGLKADPARAARMYLRIASTYGHPAAQMALGQMNISGQGVKKNPQQGLKWLTAAARKRHPGAQAYLGDLYWSGTVVKKDHTRALMWYILAAQTARPAEDKDIVDRYQEMLWSSDTDMRLEAEARARVYSDQYPASLAKE